MADEVMNTDMQDTNADPETTQEVDGDLNAENTNEAIHEDTDSSERSDGEAPDLDAGHEPAVADTPFLSIRYNKEDIPLTQEETVRLAQKGMHYENKLDYLAVQKGVSIGDLLDGMITEMESNKRAELEEQFGDDHETVEDLMRVWREKADDKYAKAVQDRKDAEELKSQSRLEEIGEQFIELKKEFPDLKTVEDIPRSVLKSAETMSLEHAYLKYLHEQENKINAAKKQQEEAAKSSSGSMNTDGSGVDTSADDFARGVWG